MTPRVVEMPVYITAYDADWPQAFRRERELLQALVGEWLSGPVEHVGSTAVPGLAAKPVIDIMAGVESLDASRPALARLPELSYCHFPYRSDVMHWLCKPGPQLRTHHLHLVPFESPLWRERIAFRDRLRADPALASEYARLKLELAERYRHDREAYTDAKAPFIRRVLASCG